MVGGVVRVGELWGQATHGRNEVQTLREQRAAFMKANKGPAMALEATREHSKQLKQQLGAAEACVRVRFHQPTTQAHICA